MHEKPEKKRRGRMRAEGPLTVDDLNERGKWNRPTRGGKREIVIEEEEGNDNVHDR